MRSMRFFQQCGTRATRALLLFAAVVALAVLPAVAAADQASQPSSPEAGLIATGYYHSCSLYLGAVRCWGFGADGALGYGNTASIGDDDAPDVVGPVALGPGRTAVAISAGSAHTCALLDDGAVRCWGFGGNGRLGYGNTATIGDDETPDSVPPVNLGRPATAISAGGGHTCAILDNGALRCWGFNLDGRLGLGRTDSIGDTEEPASVPTVNLGPGRRAKAVATGSFHTCAILDDGSVRCWGFGGNGRLGYGKTADIGRTADSTPDTVAPVYLGPDRIAKAITAGYGHTCAILDNNTVRCWGFGAEGRLGYGNTRSIGDDELPGMVTPVDLGAGRTAKAIDAGNEYTCAVLDNGGVRCWGYNDRGQLGYGTTTTVGANEVPGAVGPVALGAGRRATAISAGLEHTCARLDDMSVRCWGYGSAGRLGYCNEVSIGDNELPSVGGPVPLGVPGIVRLAYCPFAPVARPADVPVVERSTPQAPAPDGYAEAKAAEAARAAALRACLQTATRQFTADRRRARALRGAKRRIALRVAVERRAMRRTACLRRHGRTPGRISGLKAAAIGGGKIRLSFRVAGTDGNAEPAARRYVVKQSLTPMRTARDFDRAAPLCNGSCSFGVTRIQATATLTVTSLRHNQRYYYAVAARDNVSGRVGPRSATISVRAR